MSNVEPTASADSGVSEACGIQDTQAAKAQEAKARPENKDLLSGLAQFSPEAESRFNLRLHSDRTEIGKIIERLGLSWELFSPVCGGERGKRCHYLSRSEPYPQRRQAVYVEARKIMSADRISRALRVPRATIITALKRAR